MTGMEIDLSTRPTAVVTAARSQYWFLGALLVVQGGLLVLSATVGDGGDWVHVVYTLVPALLLPIAATRRIEIGPDGVTYREGWTRRISWEDAVDVQKPGHRWWLATTTLTGPRRWQRIPLAMPWTDVDGPDPEALGLAYARAHDVPILEGDGRQGYVVPVVLVAIIVAAFVGAGAYGALSS